MQWRREYMHLLAICVPPVLSVGLMCLQEEPEAGSQPCTVLPSFRLEADTRQLNGEMTVIEMALQVPSDATLKPRSRFWTITLRHPSEGRDVGDISVAIEER